MRQADESGMCPSKEKLDKFNLGKLSSGEAQQIGEHVSDCEICSGTLNVLSTECDTFLTTLRTDRSQETTDEIDRGRVVELASEIRESRRPLPSELQSIAAEIASTGILTDYEILESFWSLPENETHDSDELIAALIHDNRLTEFQGKAIRRGKGKSLTFGEYVVLDRIGAGGMGVVLRGLHRRMRREVAIKVLPNGSLDNEEAIQRFYREVEAAARLLHTNIVTAFDAGQHGRSHYLVMEYVNGRDLSALLKEQGPFPVAKTIDFLIQAAQGLEYAHHQGLIHRDVKPDNLLVDSTGTVKILDMGLARMSATGESDDGLTQSGQIMGTVDYMAPEQAVDTRKADARSDIYSLGCTMYRLLTGRPVFDGETIMNKLMAHAQQPPPDLAAQLPETPQNLQGVFQKMVAKSPEDRYQTMSSVLADLRAFQLSGSPDGVSTNESVNADVDSPTKIDKTPGASNSGSVSLNAAGETLFQTASNEQTRNVPVVAVESASGTIDSRIRTSTGWAAYAIGAGVLTVLLGVIVLLLPGSKGTLRVEILDPNVEVSVKGTEVVITEADKEEIRLSPGDHILHVTRGEFQFDTTTLQLRKDETVVVRVELVDGTMRAVSDGQIVGSVPALVADSSESQSGELRVATAPTNLPATGVGPDTGSRTSHSANGVTGEVNTSDNVAPTNFMDTETTPEKAEPTVASGAIDLKRRIIKEVIGHGGLVSIVIPSVSEYPRQLTGTNVEVPEVPFNISKIVVRNSQSDFFDDQWLASVVQLPELDALLLKGDAFTDASMELVARLPNLKMLGLEGSRVTAKGLQRIKKHSTLTYLNLQLMYVDVEMMNTIRTQFRHLEELTLSFYIKGTNAQGAYELGDPDPAIYGLLDPEGFPRLKNLEIAATMTDEYLETITSNGLTRQLYMLILSKPAAVTERGLRALGQAGGAIEHLGLTRLGEVVPFPPATLTPLSGLSNLRILQLQYCSQLTDEHIKLLGDCPNLENIAVQNSRLTDEGLLYLARYPKLYVVTCNQTAVTRAGATALQAKVPGCEVRFTENGEYIYLK